MSAFFKPAFVWNRAPSRGWLVAMAGAVLCLLALIFSPVAEVAASWSCLMVAGVLLLPACAQAHQASMEAHYRACLNPASRPT